MKTAIIYTSTHGTTEKVARMIQSAMGEENVELFNLKTGDAIDLHEYEKVIIGGSVHAGNIQKRIKDFCRNNMVGLLQKHLGLFLCCMYDGDIAVTQFNTAFPELLRSHSSSNKLVGGEFLMDKMNFFEKFLIKKISGVTESVSKIDEAKVQELVDAMKKSNA
jgi:menaquinone-dependent protoporphyrinogen oxidase